MTRGETQAAGWRTIAGLIRTHLQRNGLSLSAFSRSSGISDTTLRALLTEGTPIIRLDKRAQLGEALGIGAMGIESLLTGKAADAPSGHTVQVDAVALELALEDLTRATLSLRRVVDAGSPIESEATERPARPAPTEK